MKILWKLILIAFLSSLAFYGGMYANGGAQFFSKEWKRIASYNEKTTLQTLIKKNAPDYSLKEEFTLNGLKGAVLETASGKRIISWIFDGHLVLGNVFTKEGFDVTNTAARQHGAEHPIDALILQIQQTTEVSVLPSFRREEIEAMPGYIIEGTKGEVRLHMVSWSGCPACQSMKDYLAKAQLPFAVKICPIGGRPQTDRDGLQVLGFESTSQDSSEATAMKDRLHKTYDLVERALGKAAVPCLFWLEGEKVKFMVPQNSQEVKDLITQLSILP